MSVPVYAKLDYQNQQSGKTAVRNLIWKWFD